MKTHKKCRGTGKALGHGCGAIVPQVAKGQVNRIYGLGISCGCYNYWLLNTEAGKEKIAKSTIKAKTEREKQDRKDWNERKAKIKPVTHAKEYKKRLQEAINKLSRIIDKQFGYISCIDCGYPFTYNGDCDAGHFKSRGHNATLRYNLHNIHSQKSNCNQNALGGGKQLDYYKGLIARYGKEYADMVDTRLQKKYTYIGMKAADYQEKIKVVNKIIRDFDTFQFTDAIQARTMCNRLIGIYV